MTPDDAPNEPTARSADARSPADPAAAPATGDDLPVPLVTGDRLCPHCGYNLIGRPVRREPTYGLFVVQCPECGAHDAVTAQPAAARWTPRVVAFVLVLWLLALVGLWAATSGAMTGMTLGSIEELVDRADDRLRDLHGADPVASAAATSFADWYAGQDRAELRAQIGGLDRRAYWLHVLFVLPIVAAGILWSVLLLHRGRASLLAWSLVLVGTTAVFAVVFWIEHARNVVWPNDAAIELLGARAGTITLGLLWAELATGMMIGRPIARFVVRLLLPPRMRSVLHPLWTCDGLAPPAAR